MIIQIATARSFDAGGEMDTITLGLDDKGRTYSLTLVPNEVMMEGDDPAAHYEWVHIVDSPDIE